MNRRLINRFFGNGQKLLDKDTDNDIIFIKKYYFTL
uniref:Uncharacterized protein n=1 Tax=Tetranychus urticae TaxID=32264 RepID=T1KT17_TETUR